MPTITENIAVNGSAGAFVSLSSTQTARRIEITEDPNNGAAQGLQYQLGSEGFAKTHTLKSGSTVILGDTVAMGNGKGPIVGMVAQAGGIAATVYAKVLSATVTPTKVMTTEID